MTERWDVVVVGGGPAGSVCAASLARLGWRVLLAEAGDFSRPRPAETLGPAVVRRLQHLTGTDFAGAVGPCRGVLAQWGPGKPTVSDYELEQCGPGWVVRRPEVDRLLFAWANAAGATTRLPWRCVGIRGERSDEPVRIQFSTPGGVRVESARFVIEAAGRHSIGGASPRVHFNSQLAYFAALDEVAETQGLLWVESTGAGWWYLISLPPAGAQVVFVTESRPRGAGSDARRAFFEEQFERTRLLRRAFPERRHFELVQACDARASRPRDPAPDRVLRIGDAAGTADPLSGQGFWHALLSALAAADVVSRSLDGTGPVDSAAFARSSAERFDQQLETRASFRSLATLRP